MYNALLKDCDLILPFEIPEVYAVYHLYVVRIKNEKRKQFQEYLKANGVATGIHYPIALPYLKAYAYLNHNEKDFPEATAASHEVLSLPMYPELTEEQIDIIVNSIADFFSR